MNTNELDAILKQTLEDHRLSRGERRALQDRLQSQLSSGQARDVIRSRAFELAGQEVISPDAAGVLHWLEDMMRLLDPPPAAATGPAEAFFSPGTSCRQAILERLRGVTSNLDICVFTITDNDITQAVIDAHRRRVAVRIITDNDKATDLGSDVQKLENLGIPLRLDQTPFHMHHKYAIFDRRQLLTGSYNWTRSAAEKNEENLVVLRDKNLTLNFQQHFDELWRELG